MDRDKSSSETAFHDPTSSGANSQFIVAGSLESLNKTTSTQRKTDVLHSTLYAQVVADSKCSRCDVESWYKEFVRALVSVGWQIDMFEFQQYTPSGIFFKLSRVISTSFNEPETTSDLLQRLLSLRVTNPKVQLFHQHTLKQNTANFQVLQVMEDDEKGTTVRFTAYSMSMPKSWMSRIMKLNISLISYLFASMPTLLVQLFCGAQEGTLADEKYAVHREHVLRELTNSQLSEMIVNL